MYLLEVFVTNASLNVNRAFTYCHDRPIEKYCRVKVFFHEADNVGLVISCTFTDERAEELEERLGFEVLNIKEVIDEEPVISDEIYELAKWLSKTTISPFVSCLNAMLPKTLKTSRKNEGPKMVRRFHVYQGDFDLTDRQKEVYDQLYEGMEAAQARKISTGIISKLIEKRAIEEYSEESVYSGKKEETKAFKTLTADQQKAYDAIISTDKMVSLLFGVTGSGKTEVYLHLARYYLNMDKDVMILVPEISLTPQMIARVKERFADVIFYHSELSDQERYEQYKRVKNREVRIVVGTRSSIFLPFRDLGLIIIDEEHDSSYKQDSTPCYHVRNVAFRRAMDNKAKVLLASATPSLDSYTRAQKDDYQLLELKNRINLQLPDIQIIDLGRQVRNRDSYIVSAPLKKEIDKCLDSHKQSIILLNRRGYSPIIKCSDCQTTLMCQDCDTPLNYHKDEGVLKCHQCGRIYRMPETCPNCHQKSLIYYGFGTKKVEEELHRLYPDAGIERMDRDNVSRKGAHEKILKRFEKHEIDILIGTQMIAKGLDYPDVTLVGILNADAGLMHQDYNSAKVTFDLLMQAAGRSGRADTAGKVIIQAFNTDHYAIKAVINQDYNYFYNIEMNYRHKTNYPPYSHMIEIILSDERNERLEKSVAFLYEKMQELPYRSYRPYDLGKLKRQYRCRLLMMDRDLRSMIDDVQKMIDLYVKQKNMSRVKIDVDPLYLE
ncbi:MAG: primosomal protein N' [Erysipelotrichaceae bacterium]|nr:primosomal protein N' [Erysipelotrichaceae bacterium]